MIDEDVTITELVNDGLLRKNLDYVEKVVGNCYRMYQERGWKGEHVRVRIGRSGNGSSPHYTIEYGSDDFDLTKPFKETQFSKRGMHEQFSGLSHQKEALGFDRNHWSTETQSLSELEDLRNRLRVGSLRSR